MTEAKGLRIGNYFIGYDGQPFQFDIGCFALLNDGVGIDEIIKVPIPLSEERLLKAGFTLSQLLVEDNESPLVKDAYFGKNPVTHDHLIHLKNTGKGWFYGSSHHKVPYVHSLQNLVFDLAGIELTFDTTPPTE